MDRFCLEQCHFFAAEMRALQAAEFLGNYPQPFPAFGAIFQGGEAFEFFGEFDDQTLLHTGSEARGALLGAELTVFRGEFVQAHAALFVTQPILVSAATPLGEILFQDGPAGKALGQNLFYLGQFVEPGDEVSAKCAVVEAAI